MGLLRWIKFTTGLLFVSVSFPASSALMQINLGDFSNAKVLDFESATLGSISGTDTLFTGFGISSISTTASDFTDAYGDRTNSSRALWENSNGLVIVDPDDLDETLANVITYTLQFSGFHTKFGIGVHDQNTGFRYAFFNGVTSVGSLDIASGTSDLAQRYFSSSDLFDRVTVSSIAPVPGGFAIDNITLEAGSQVPEPSVLALFGLGLVSLMRAKKKA